MRLRFNEKKVKYLKPINAVMRLFIHKEKPWGSNHIHKILIVNVTLLGDEIMNLPMYRVIKKHMPNAEVTILGKPWIKEQLIRDGLVDKFIEFDGISCLSTPVSWIKNWRIIRNRIRILRKEQFDIAIEPRGDFRYIFFMYLCRSNRTLSYNTMNTDYLLTDIAKPVGDNTHEIDARINLVESLGAKVKDYERIPKLSLMKEQKKENEEFIINHHLEHKYLIGIHPGASLKIKQYPFYPELVREIGRKLQNKDNYAVLIFCGKGDEEVASAVADVAKTVGLDHVVCKDDLRSYIGRVELCDYMICNDSGAGHIAGAYGKDITVIFGPVDPKLYSPRSIGVVDIYSKDLACKPCLLKKCPKQTDECIRGIDYKVIADRILLRIAGD